MFLRSIWLCGCVLALSTSVLARAEESAKPAAKKPNAAKPSKLKVNGEAKSGQLTWCPIADQNFIVASDTPGVEHNGKTYYFCCDECAEKFRADPAKWVAAIENHR